MNKLQQTKFWLLLEKFLRFGLIVCGIAVVAIVFMATVTRAAHVAFKGYEEFLVIFAIWLYMFGTANGSFEKSHITADILAIMMKEGLVKDILALIRSLLTLVLGFMFFTWALQLTQWTIIMGTRTPTWRIPMTVSQSALLFGLTIATFFNAVYFYNDIKGFIMKYKERRAGISGPKTEGEV
ncbi:MAG: TRAP transporter small permease [Anaerovoracaceae bacterium]|nr:TRAP transporter small permease [Bacillota bacterium]HPZ59917.1 TRAP transporter small permease [Bacillota bacterium]